MMDKTIIYHLFQLWINCLNFWTEVQDYHWLFYTEFIDPYILKKKAKVGRNNEDIDPYILRKRAKVNKNNESISCKNAS